MENIRQAVERAKVQAQRLDTPRQARRFSDIPQVGEYHEVELDAAYLQSQRLVAFNGNDPFSRPFDILRTEVLRSMDLKGWKTLAVTSPTPNCGKTLTAINLALSMARQRERQVLLADLDLRKPRIATNLGINCKEGVVGVIEGRTELRRAALRARVGDSRLDVLPTIAAANSSDLVDSSAMKTLLEEISSSEEQITILDLPPVLTGHDVISILPQIDCVLLVAAIGTSRISDIRETNSYLSETNVVRFVLNKVPGPSTTYAYY